MAQSELTQSEYETIKNGLAKLSDNKASAEYHVGKRRVAMVRRSKSYAGYLQIRRNEARKAAESRPAKAVPGVSELPQENAEFLAEAPNGDSIPADKVKVTTAGNEDLRTDEELAQAARDKKDAARRAAANEANRKYARRERIYGIVTLVVIGFALLGIVVAGVWIFSHIF